MNYLRPAKGGQSGRPLQSAGQCSSLAIHTGLEDVGKIAAQAEVKTRVLSHFVPGDDSSITDDQ
jgi:ribonuclease BN (tRNA processing enzyme)